MDILKEAKDIAEWIVALSRQIHRHPELMYEEVKTSQLVRDTLDQLHIPYQYPARQNGCRRHARRWERAVRGAAGRHGCAADP